MIFQKKLDAVIKKNNSLVCIGLDPTLEKLPTNLRSRRNPLFQFNKGIIDSTHDLVCAYKPNTAFYEGYGAEGVTQLKMTCDYLKGNFPHIPIIIDAKRADIGNTNHGYTNFVFEYLQGDAVTVQPYLGGEALKPFLDKKDKGIIILCRTSNPGSGEFQNLAIKGRSLYKLVAQKVVTDWNKNKNCLLVVGATYPQELAEVRRIVGEMTLLVPGIGAQGGDIESTVKAGLNKHRAGMIINSSRGIIFASNKKDFAEKAREETLKLRNQINKYLFY